ncbi:hypothetical protein MKW92_032780 [Papaver armeniacum]|nr:hypothetical protein MKW92_032780 [Papaver armeniacum]
MASNMMTVAIKEYQGASGVPNQIFEAAETFLNTKVSTKTKGVELSKSEGDKKVDISVDKRCQSIEDDFEGIHLIWRLVGGTRSASTYPYSRKARMMDSYSQDPAEGTDESPTRFELSFDENHYGKVVESYIPYVVKKAKELKDANTTWKIYGGSVPYSGHAGGVNLQHPSTFQNLAMDPELKKDIIDDLDRFVKGRDYYKKVGKAWKRSYLLYGPPGTGKSSLVAAMADYLNFDIYDMELTNSHSYSSSQLSHWRSVLMGIKSRTIILIQDIDCTAETHDRINIREPVHPYARPHPANRNSAELTLSGLLKVIDGMWSSCGDEKIIIFTTNHKDKLDPALLRPGRIDKHIHMSYIAPQGFRILASNYLSIEEHRLFGEIDELIQESQTTPAEVAEQLMVSDEADISLNGLIQFLKTKLLVAKQVEEEAQKETNKYGSRAPIPYPSRSQWEEHYGRYY